MKTVKVKDNKAVKVKLDTKTAKVKRIFLQLFKLWESGNNRCRLVRYNADFSMYVT